MKNRTIFDGDQKFGCRVKKYQKLLIFVIVLSALSAAIVCVQEIDLMQNNLLVSALMRPCSSCGKKKKFKIKRPCHYKDRFVYVTKAEESEKDDNQSPFEKEMPQLHVEKKQTAEVEHADLVSTPSLKISEPMPTEIALVPSARAVPQVKEGPVSQPIAVSQSPYQSPSPVQLHQSYSVPYQQPVQQMPLQQPMPVHQPIMMPMQQPGMYQNPSTQIASMAMQMQAQAMAMQAQASALMMQAQQQAIPTYAQPVYQSYQPGMQDEQKSARQQKIEQLMYRVQQLSLYNAQAVQQLLLLLDKELDIVEKLLANAGGFPVDQLVQERNQQLHSALPGVAQVYNLIIALATNNAETDNAQLYSYFVRKGKKAKQSTNSHKKRKFLVAIMSKLQHYYDMIENMQQTFG